MKSQSARKASIESEMDFFKAFNKTNPIGVYNIKLRNLSYNIP